MTEPIKQAIQEFAQAIQEIRESTAKVYSTASQDGDHFSFARPEQPVGVKTASVTPQLPQK